MKNCLRAFLSIILISPLLADKARKVGEVDELPKNGFVDFVSLKKWASNSSFGGGMAGKVQIAGQDVYYTKRSVTSGRATSELVFYTISDNDRIQMFLLIPIQFKEFSVSTEMDTIMVTTYNSVEKGWELAMTINSKMIPNKSKKSQ